MQLKISSLDVESSSKTNAKPFLKWAGGKTQLISAISDLLPCESLQRPFTYIEPFIGSGAIFFWMMNNFSNIEDAIINDINTDLIDCYKTIKNDLDNLIEILSLFQQEYHALFNDLDKAKEFYYDKRELFNTRNSSKTMQSALLIFLNKAGFNGLYRVNSKNKFNVPIGRSKSLPKICDIDNLIAVSKVLQRTTILNGEYYDTVTYAKSNTLFYLDPPYKPLNNTSSFNSYAKDIFADEQQIDLKKFCDKLNSLNYRWILSNSDMKNVNPQDEFFDDLYKDYNIIRVQARRSINSKSSKRGKLSELLITNIQK